MTQNLDIAALHVKHNVLLSAWKKDGDRVALQAILDDYKPLFGKLIRETMRGHAFSLDHRKDLEQECMVAALKAIDNFELDKGTKLTTYLLLHVKGAMRRYTLDFKAPCRLGTSSDDRKAYYSAQRIHAQRAMSGEGGLHDGDILAVAKDSATSETTARRAVRALQANHCDLDAVADMIEEPDATAAFIETNALQTGMTLFENVKHHLPDRTRKIVEATFLSHHTDRTMQRLAEEFGLTIRRVRQLQKEGLEQLRSLMEEEGIMADSLF
jgi:RNA polymerase sigma-32 factor